MTNKLPYASFHQAQQCLYELEAIDYYLAKELTLDLLNLNEQVGESSNSPLLCFHLIVALSQSVRQGHSCLPLSVLANHKIGAYCDSQGLVTHHGFQFSDLSNLIDLANTLNITPEDNRAIVISNGDLYLRRNYIFEQELASKLNAKMAQTNSFLSEIANSSSVLTSIISELFPDNDNIEEIDWQKIAVANSVNKRFSVIAGGPGTGKTYTVTKLISAILMLAQQAQLELDIALVAPTGKAAQRLSESITKAVGGFSGIITQSILDKIPTQAQTLHRMLGVIPNQVNFRRNESAQLTCDVLIVDEVSMVDLALMTRLFRALPDKTQVILLGDADQLPSVALGNVLTDIAVRPHLGYSPKNFSQLIEIAALSTKQQKSLPKAFSVSDKKSAKNNNADHLSLLLKSRRFDGSGSIGKMADWIIKGQAQESWQFLANSNEIAEDLSYSPAEMSNSTNPSDWLRKYVEQYYQPLIKAENIASAFSLLAKFRILVATRQGDNGVEQINSAVFQLLGKKYLQESVTLFHGLPIMIKQNHYGLQLFNGDIGIVWTNEKGHLVVAFENENAGFNYFLPSRLPPFEPVFAMTIHKTQGSEFGHVAMALPTYADNPLLTRELLYTGVTRAKEKLSIITNENVWHRSVEQQVKRYSGLKYLLSNKTKT